jgi:hypothetical protein
MIFIVSVHAVLYFVKLRSPLFIIIFSVYFHNFFWTWTVKSKDKSRLTAAEMRFVRKYAEYTWRDRNTNEGILNELKVTSILDEITCYKSDWIQHVNRMPR